MSGHACAPEQHEPSLASASIAPDLELRYVEAGDPGGVAVILLHGYSDSHRSYLPLMAALPPSFRLIALTQRGHGDSGKPSDGYETSRFADDLDAFMNALDIPRAVLVGHSFGTLVAMRFAIDRPGRVLGLALLGGFRTLAGNPGMEELWHEIAGAAEAVDSAFVRAFQESTLARPIPAERLESAISESQKMPARVWKSVARHLLDEDFSGEIARIAAPTVLLWGEKDAFTGRTEQDLLTAAIGGSELVAIPEAGHAVHWEDPEGTAAILARFCAERVQAPVAVA